MSEDGEYVGGRQGGVHYDPTPPLVPTDAGPGHVAQDRHGPLDLALLDQVDEGVQRLAVAPLTPRSKRIKDLESMVEEQSAKHRSTVREAQEIIDHANEETRALQREKDGAGWRPQPPASSASLSAMPTPFEFGGFHSVPTARGLPVVSRPHHPSPLSSPPRGSAQSSKVSWRPPSSVPRGHF